MSKKILAGILAAASILSISSIASAADDMTATKPFGTGDGKASGTYTVSMEVTYGDVSAEIPDTSLFSAAYLNPYNATVKTYKVSTVAGDNEGDPDKEVLTVIAKNNSPVASGVFTVKNLDTEEGLKVVAKTKITKATGVVVKNPSNTTAPFGWAQVSPDKDKPYDYLTDYDKLTLKNSEGKAVKEADGVAKIDATKSSGGGVSDKQGKNIGMWLKGGLTDSSLEDAGTIKNLKFDAFDEDTCVAFDPKLEVTGDLMTIAKAADEDNPRVGYFTIGGQLSETAKNNIDEAKDKVTFTVAFKLMPVAPTP